MVKNRTDGMPIAKPNVTDRIRDARMRTGRNSMLPEKGALERTRLMYCAFLAMMLDKNKTRMFPQKARSVARSDRLQLFIHR